MTHDENADVNPSAEDLASRPARSIPRWAAIGGCVVIAVLILSNVVLWVSLTSTKSDLQNAEAKLGRVDSGVRSAFRVVADRVDAIETQLGGVGAGGEDLAARTDDIEFALDDLYLCVNEFLDGFDAANGGFFTFQFC